jgi:hypothetical protein
MLKRAWVAVVVVVLWPAHAAIARIVLPEQLAPTDDGQLYYFALDGARALAYDSSLDVLAVPLDRSATDVGSLAPIASIPQVAQPMCRSTDPEDEIGGGESIATGEGQLLAAGYAGCKLGDGTASSVEVAGPDSGPFTAVTLDPCLLNSDASNSIAENPHVAISSRYAACADPDSGLILTSSLAERDATRSYHPRGGVQSLKLDGEFMAVDSGSSITVIDLRNGARRLRVTRSGPLVYALGDDGTLVLGRSQRSPGPCRTLTGLAWYSPGSARAHPLHDVACSRSMFVIGRRLVFQAPSRNSLIAIERVSLNGSKPQLLARYTRFGALLDADSQHVLAVDGDCHGDEVAFVAPGGTGADPSASCPRR